MNLPQNVQIKIDDDTLKGRHANMMQVAHNKEEFVLDFMNIFPPTGIAVARIFVSPGHAKRVARALAENLTRYEEAYGEIKEAELPSQPFGFNAK